MFKWDGSDLILNVVVQPKSNSSQIIGNYNGRLKIKLISQPIDGKANEELSKLLAKAFKVPKSHITIENGINNSNKIIRIPNPKIIPDYLSTKKL